MSSSSNTNYKWLWCDDHAKVTNWFLSLTDRHEYALFYASFINTANRHWEISIDTTATAKKLEPLGQLIVECLDEDPIPTDWLIEALSGYHKFIGGTKGNLKGTGVIRFDNTPPDMASIQRGETKLYNLIARYYKQPKIKDEGIQDEEMEDAEMEVEQEKQHTKFEIAIVGGRKKIEDEDEDMA
ncbi:hypothetical protein M436DRAFT_61227 [Aureobasidium namibiae CBS 147.97]|uniref:Uncharacterized protein n=1 Tax=Aureobasidium namibiae CBS 147.97 TaxID=1043004 RepID=A0A074WWK8_9PEZI